ncbi:selenoprotein BthD [Anopheles sinensis]|uniref:Selenoprotein BthD n=1 Tax=Anopheles sinensis TaxID=74873 RepID=A0A084W8N4_ANOSI|nr:selenoprotein BthD [Anopheles sinensis]
MPPRRKRTAAAKSTERKATEVHAELCKLAPEQNFQLVLNESGKPRRGSFEIAIAKEKDGKQVLVWSGLPKGPPRKDKFPDVKSILDDVLKALK